MGAGERRLTDWETYRHASRGESQTVRGKNPARPRPTPPRFLFNAGDYTPLGLDKAGFQKPEGFSNFYKKKKP